MIIALGYQVQSQVTTRFRCWARLRLHEYIQKGSRWMMNGSKKIYLCSRIKNEM